MDTLEGKSFSITDPQGVNTVIYQINKTEKELLKAHIHTTKDMIYSGFLSDFFNFVSNSPHHL